MGERKKKWKRNINEAEERIWGIDKEKKQKREWEEERMEGRRET